MINKTKHIGDPETMKNEPFYYLVAAVVLFICIFLTLITVGDSQAPIYNCNGQVVIPCSTDMDCMQKNPGIDFSLSCKQQQ